MLLRRRSKRNNTGKRPSGFSKSEVIGRLILVERKGGSQLGLDFGMGGNKDKQIVIVGNSFEIMCNMFTYHMRKIIKCLQ